MFSFVYKQAQDFLQFDTDQPIMESKNKDEEKDCDEIDVDVIGEGKEEISSPGQ